MGSTQKSKDERIQKVQPLLLRLEKNKNDYFPQAVSFGPFHHGEPDLAFVESFKPTAVDLFISDGPGERGLYYTKVLDNISEIRNSYDVTSMGSYSDEYLAEMMLRDASLIVIYMEISSLDETELPDNSIMEKFLAMNGHLGMLTLAVLSRDLILLENQVPLRVIEILMDLRYGAGQYENLLTRYMNIAIFGENHQKTVLSSQPLHLLAAIYRLVVSDDCDDLDETSRRCNCTWQCCFTAADEQTGVDPELGASQKLSRGDHRLIRRLLKPFPCKNEEQAKQKNSKTNIKKFIHSFRSATSLKAKGIYFKPSPTLSLTDVTFISHFFYATLRLPEWGVSAKTRVTFVNLIAYELSPNSQTIGVVVSYVSLMKSLIEKAEDAKELRERKILYNMLGSDEEVLSVYREIDTHGADNPAIFRAVRDKIQAHYNSRVQTWMAELVHANFRSPWAMIAFLAAIALVAISAGQLYYAVHPN